ncbi:PKD domain-containing protein [Croceibacterium ferulae]|uniref:PKD domain-containing protein n=1 Tax=Croceibacterium ferulae TaxID=1854641 RepID=UPI000EB43E57|nr:PKD domain-containing protein [Croceibacterium ferulae]
MTGSAAIALRWLAGGVLLATGSVAQANERPDCEYQIFQFAADAIPRIDGRTDDWDAVGGDYIVGSERLKITDGSDESPDPANLDVRVRVGWVKGMNRLYVLYEASDDYWDFAERGLRNDTFELVVDGNRSGGPLIARFHPDRAPEGTDSASSARYVSAEDAWFSFQNITAQNYHIFTPAFQKDWAMAWGPQASWIKRLPWSNIAYDYSFSHGEGGRLVAEFWITPFDHADPAGPDRSVESVLRENGVVGMAWAVIDYDGPNTRPRHFWNLSPHHTMYGQASQLCPFRLMPIEGAATSAEAAWSFTIIDRDRRVVAFRDETAGPVSEWSWDFGDGTRSIEQHPVHLYADPGKFVVTLDVNGPAGRSSHTKVWDVSFAGDPEK